MLVCSNDGFTGVDGVSLPRRTGESLTRFTRADDAGTEVNTEDFADIVPPCQGLIGVTGAPGAGPSNRALGRNGAIRPHPGIQGTAGGLSSQAHGWTDPVAQISVTRLS